MRLGLCSRDAVECSGCEVDDLRGWVREEDVGGGVGGREAGALVVRESAVRGGEGAAVTLEGGAVAVAEGVGGG